MTTFATADGTKKYASRMATRVAPGHFREQQNLWLSSIGIGTYLGEPDALTDQAYTDAVVAAVESGANVIDSAINYRFQRSERSVGAALAELARRGFTREEILVCTKGGFLTPDGDMPADASEYFNREYVATGILCEGDVAGGCHSMAPNFLADQLERSRRNLGVETIDVYYLHNPERSSMKCRARCLTAACGRRLNFWNPRWRRRRFIFTVWRRGTGFAKARKNRIFYL